MRERIQAVMEHVDALSARERGLVFLTALSVLYITWWQVLFEPLVAERDRVASEVERTRVQIHSIHSQIAELANRSRKDPDAVNRARLTVLREELQNLESSLRQVTKQLVPPEQMARLLETVLTREEGLELVQLEGLGARPVFDPAGDGTASAEGERGEGGTMLFRHGLRIEFEGDYLASLRYLNALEELPWQFLWERVELEVEEHPTTRVSITVHSLSLERAWIGV